MTVSNQGMSRNAVLAVGAGIAVLFSAYNYVSWPIKEYNTLNNNVNNNTQSIEKLANLDDLIREVSVVVDDHEEALNHLWPLATQLKASVAEQTIQLNQLIDFANSWDRFTAQDWLYLQQKHNDDIINITAKIEEMKVIQREILAEIRK